METRGRAVRVGPARVAVLGGRVAVTVSVACRVPEGSWLGRPAVSLATGARVTVAGPAGAAGVPVAAGVVVGGSVRLRLRVAAARLGAWVGAAGVPVGAVVGTGGLNCLLMNTYAAPSSAHNASRPNTARTAHCTVVSPEFCLLRIIALCRL